MPDDTWEQVPDPWPWQDADAAAAAAKTVGALNAALDHRALSYILLPGDPATPIPADTLTWARWFEDNGRKERRVGSTRYRGYWISTVFLGLDQRFHGPPALWETEIFHDSTLARRRRYLRRSRRRHGRADMRGWPAPFGLHGWLNRYSSYRDALKGHSDAVRMVRSLYG